MSLRRRCGQEKPEPNKFDLSKVRVTTKYERFDIGLNDGHHPMQIRVTACYFGRLVGGAIVSAPDPFTKAITGQKFTSMGYIKTEEAYRGKGVATRIYEAAARMSCLKFKAPMASDTQRTTAADAFWKKQFKKGRAVKFNIPKANRALGSRATIFALSCPAPKSLKGLKGN